MKTIEFCVPLTILLLSLACSSPIFAAVKFDTSPNANYQQELFIAKKSQNRSFLKRAWQSVFKKKQHRQKPSYRGVRFIFGVGALVAISLAAIAFFIHVFWTLAFIAWAASIVLGDIGLFKDEREAMAIIALSLALVFPLSIIILISVTCCGP